MAQPKVWLQTDGETTTVHTPFTTRAKDKVEGCFKRRLTWILSDFGKQEWREELTMPWCNLGSYLPSFAITWYIWYYLVIARYCGL